MPNTSEGFDQVEASASPEHAVNVVKFESVQSDPAPRRRRGGRRVVRGVGAAGASLELKVEEHASAPLFEEPKLPVAQPAHDTGDSADSEGMTRPTRRRRRPVQSDMMFVRLPTNGRRVLVAVVRCRLRMSRTRIVRRVVAAVSPMMRMSTMRCRVVALPSMIPMMRSRLWSVPWMPSICCRKAMRSATIRVR